MVVSLDLLVSTWNYIGMIPGLLSIWGDHWELQTTLKQPQPYIQVSMFITVLQISLWQENSATA